MIARAWGAKGTMLSTPFFARFAGIVQVATIVGQLRPRHVGDLIAALRRQHEHPNDRD